MTDDLLPLLTMPAAPGPSQDVRWRQGTVVTFNQITLQNTVDIGGTVLADLPILGVAEATSLVPGSVVGLLAIESTLGTVTYAILGRLVTPNTPAATEAISLLSSWIAASSITTQETISSTTYGDMTTVGPAVDFTVRATGRVLLIVTCQMQRIDLDPADGFGASVTVELSGANVIPAATMATTVRVARFSAPVGASSNTDQVTTTQAVVLEGLTPGATQAVMKYAIQVAGEGVDIGRRSLIAITL